MREELNIQVKTDQIPETVQEEQIGQQPDIFYNYAGKISKRNQQQSKESAVNVSHIIIKRRQVNIFKLAQLFSGMQVNCKISPIIGLNPQINQH